MASFTLDDIKLCVPDKALTEQLRKHLENGNYEWKEAGAVKHHVKAGDTVLDIGAGAGYISLLAGRAAGPENVVAVEANPMMMEALRHNLDDNGAKETRLLHGAVVADNFDEDSVLFASRPAFWASSIADENTDPSRIVEVPALKLSALLEEHQPSVVSIDVEGGELELCQQPWPACVRLVVMEIHSSLYKAAGIKAILDGMSANNMTIMPWGTRGELFVLQRVKD
ncbi:MAG TPA: FkbM family methyltransferase [Maritimibacter sp.]|nr:FkbM family methyltransferase [Maritimibacter sp.]